MTNDQVLAEGLVSLQDACDFLGIGRSLLYQQLNEGLLDSVKIGRRRLIPRRALVAFAESKLRRGAATLSMQPGS